MPSREEMEAAVEHTGSKRGAARLLGIPESTLRHALTRMVDVNKVRSVPHVALPDEFAVRQSTVTYDKHGDVARQSVTTRPAAGEKFEMMPGHQVKGESAFVDAQGRIIGKWIKTREGALGEGLVEALQAAFAKFEGAAPVTPPSQLTKSSLHTIYPLADLHLGMYAWGQETGEAYDVDIAKERARKAYRSLVSLVPPSKTCTLLNLGDYFHANDQKNVTPASGHQLDVDGRHARVLEAGVELKLELIDTLLQVHDQVEVVELPGNHDPEATIAMRIALKLFYKKNPRVTVHDSPRIAWYRRFGKNLFGATHGHTIKPGEVAGMMACDRPEDWGQTEFRAFFTGHIHHERAVEKGGVRQESFQTLASRDAYATNGGWRSGHSVQAITYHLNQGEFTRSRVNVLARSHKKDRE